jgi:hypothetical protein
MDLFMTEDQSMVQVLNRVDYKLQMCCYWKCGLETKITR